MDYFLQNHASAAKLWADILSLLRQRVSEDTFQRWFELTSLVRWDDDVLELSIPNEIYRFWIEENHMPALQDAIIQLLGTPRLIKFVQNGRISAKEPDAEQTLLSGHQDPSEKSSYDATPNVSGSVDADGDGDSALARAQTRANLNNRYLFESFVVGSNSRFAQAAASAVADKPSRIYNPFFVCGGSGLGKTHMIQAIGNQILATRKNAKVLYVSSEPTTS